MASITKDTDEKSPVAYESVEETTKDEAPIAAMEELGQGGFDEKATKRLLRKIDWNLLPLITVLYLLSFLDRTNIGNARLASLEEDLNMTGLDYNISLAVFFPLYIASEIPSNLAMKRFRPSIWIPTIMVAWGVTCTLMGIVNSFTGLIIARCALGLAEGGLFPGINYYITQWYRRNECGLRMALVFSSTTCAGAFGGLLARGIVEMDGVGNLAGWSWIFILEGLVTVVFAVIAYFFMHDYPSTARFLNEKEKNEVIRRLEHDRSILPDEFDLKYVKHALKDWKIWWHMVMTIGLYTPPYAFALFAPTIVRDLGYTDNSAQLMSAPPYVVACLLCVLSGYFADKHGQRGIYIFGFCTLAVIGYILLMTVQSVPVRYLACFLVAGGAFPNVPQSVAWNGNNIGGSVKRGVGIAMQIGFGNLGGVLSSFVYRNEDAPYFIRGHGTLLGLMVVSMCMSAFLSFWFRRENARRDRTYKKPEEYTIEEMTAHREEGDNAPFFRYVV